MYLPETFRIDDRELLVAHAATNPFATLITHGAAGIVVSHVPLLIDGVRGVLAATSRGTIPSSPISRPEPRRSPSFHGPHAYVSPSVYEEQPAVPTWNYVVVHVPGTRGCRGERAALDARRHGGALRRHRIEARRPRGVRPEKARRFEIGIERLEGKWKLSQNRSATDQARVAGWLERGDEHSRAVAAMMRERLRSS